MEALKQQSMMLYEENRAPQLNRPLAMNLKTPVANCEFSFFSKPVTNTLPERTVNVMDVFKMITSERYATQTRVLRCLLDPHTARNYKARNFDYVCFSGAFSRRRDADLIQHSGLLTIDFDHVVKLHKLKHALILNPYFETVLTFFSPSGDGLKWIVKIDLNKFSHISWFLAIQSYVRTTYDLEIDKSGKDVSRCCFLPYDEEAYINPKYIF